VPVGGLGCGELWSCRLLVEHSGIRLHTTDVYCSETVCWLAAVFLLWVLGNPARLRAI
jgi:hypothetical protein